MAHRPNILKLATKISLEGLTYTGVTYNDPEYMILEPIVDDDMCQIMMHMRMEANRTAEEIARRAKKDLDFTLAGKQPTRWTPALCALAFIISGLGSGLFAVGGPMMVLYFLAHTDSTEEFLADTQTIFVLNAAPTLYLRLTGGLLTAAHAPYLIPGLIGVLAGFVIAGKLVGRIDKPRLTKLVYTAVGVSGLLYLFGM